MHLLRTQQILQLFLNQWIHEHFKNLKYSSTALEPFMMSVYEHFKNLDIFLNQLTCSLTFHELFKKKPSRTVHVHKFMNTTQKIIKSGSWTILKRYVKFMILWISFRRGRHQRVCMWARVKLSPHTTDLHQMIKWRQSIENLIKWNCMLMIIE